LPDDFNGCRFAFFSGVVGVVLFQQFPINLFRFLYGFAIFKGILFSLRGLMG
jgi:hypothetical protein